jgi:hypothetical protein
MLMEPDSLQIHLPAIGLNDTVAGPIALFSLSWTDEPHHNMASIRVAFFMASEPNRLWKADLKGLNE